MLILRPERAWGQESCPSTIPTMACPEQAKYESYLSQGQAGIQVCLSLVLYYMDDHVHEASCRSHIDQTECTTILVLKASECVRSPFLA